MTSPYRGVLSTSVDQQPGKEIPGLSPTGPFRFVVWYCAAFSAFMLGLTIVGLGTASLSEPPVWVAAVTLGLSSFTLLSVPGRAWIGARDLRARFAFRNVTIPRADVERARRIMMDAGLSETSQILFVIPTRAVLSGVCLIKLEGRVRPGGDPFSVRDRITALDLEENDDGSPWLRPVGSNSSHRRTDKSPQ